MQVAKLKVIKAMNDAIDRQLVEGEVDTLSRRTILAGFTPPELETIRQFVNSFNWAAFKGEETD